MAPGIRVDDLAEGQAAGTPLYELQDAEHLNFQPLGSPMHQPLAVVGFSLKFPQDATSTESFWSMMMEGRCAVTDIPATRMEIDSFYSPDATRRDTLPFRGGHFLKEDLGAFDAPFFSITPAEAADMCPMQRGLLETTYRALENAGIPLESVIGSKTSVYTGCFSNDYLTLLCKDPQAAPKYAAAGTAVAMLANRISWFFNLLGPSVNLDSACSSSMMAFDLACQGLWNGDCKMSIVAGCNLMYSIDTMSTLSNVSFLSRDSRCYSFDHRANGYSRGEGFGVIVIKPLSIALKDGDTIRAVVRSTGTNHDGRTAGITQPSKYAQEQLIRETYRKASLDMKATRFFESHGTGTPLGDPTEASAIGAAFRNQRQPSDPLYIGALKSNIGHLEGASGVAGLIKAILVLERALIPPNTNFETLNPKIDAHHLNLEFPIKATPWPHDGLRRASVNSFGFGGTNCHVILDDAYNYLRSHALLGNHCTLRMPPPIGVPLQIPNKMVDSAKCDGPQDPGSERPKLLVWSAADERGLDRIATVYSDHFSTMSIQPEDVDPYLEMLAYTLGKRRTSMLWKSFAVTSSMSNLVNLKMKLSTAVESTMDRHLGFIFTGQGAQWPRMGQELVAFPLFRNSLHAAQIYFHSLGCSWSLLDEVAKSEDETRIHESEYSQPLCTALQVALIDLLRGFALLPTTVVGHSSGEIAAAYCIGAISRQSAWKLGYYRGALASKLTAKGHKRGAMMSVGLSEEGIRTYLKEVDLGNSHLDVVIGCINSPQNITLSGDEVQIDALKLMLDKQQVFTRKLQVKVAYHSPQMNEIANDYAVLIKDLEGSDFGSESTKTMMVSTVTGDKISPELLRKAEYWVANMVSPVLFSQALSRTCSGNDKKLRKKVDGSHRDAMKVHDLLEIGPHSALQGPVRDVMKANGRANTISYQSALVRQRSGAVTLLEAIGRLYCIGHLVDLDGVNRPIKKLKGQPMVLTDLPEYPFDHTKIYWTENRLSKSFRFRKAPRLDLLGTRDNDWNQHEAKWRHTIKVSELPWVEDHKISGAIVYPAAAMLVMAIEAANQVARSGLGIKGFNIKDIVFRNVLNVPATEEGIDTQFYLRSAASGTRAPWYHFQLYSYTNGDWADVCHGSIQVDYVETDGAVDSSTERSRTSAIYDKMYEAGHKACSQAVDTQQFYMCLQDCGLDYGSSFQLLRAMAHNNNGEAVGQLSPFEWVSDAGLNPAQDHIVHPTTLDCVLQVTFAALFKGGLQKMPTTIPTKVNRLWIANSGLQSTDLVKLYTKVKAIGRHEDAFVLGLDSVDSSPRIIIEGLETTHVSENTPQSQDMISRLCYNIYWKPDINLLDQDQVMNFCQAVDAFQSEPVELCQNLQLLVLVYITKTVQALDETRYEDLEVHIQKYVSWMRLQLDRFNDGTLPCRLPQWSSLLQDPDYQLWLENKMANASVQGKFYTEVGRNLLDIIEGRVDPLVLLFQGNLAKEYYQDIANSVSFMNPLLKYLDALAHKNPGMNILEVGAGTAGMTTHIMKTLNRHGFDEIGSPRYAHYDYTDLSRSFFQSAQDLFRDQGARITFNALNIEHEPVSQGFEAGSYDLVIAASVLHATKDLDNAVRNIRQLLKPGGKLLLLEITRTDKLGCGFIFGLLSSWWRELPSHADEEAEGYDRKWSPCVSKSTWEEVARRNGFSKAELVLDDFANEWCQETSIMIFTAIEEKKSSFNHPRTSILTLGHSPSQQRTAIELQSALSSAGFASCRIVTLRDASNDSSLSDDFCISLVEMGQSVLAHLDAHTFEAVRSTLTTATNMLWVTDQEQPHSGIMVGLARVLRTENPQLVLVTLALESRNRGIQHRIKTIVQALRATIPGIADRSFETDYTEEDGILHIGRVVGADYLNRQISSQLIPKQIKLQEFGQGPPLTLSVGSPGLLDSLRFVEDVGSNEPLAADEIEIEVMAVGLNFRDLLIALGKFNMQTAMGGECAGIVTRTGKHADIQVGDRVAIMYLDTFKTFARCPYQCAVPLPDNISFSVAAAIPVTFTTAYHALHEIARMHEGESVLIHSAAGGTGQSAVQIAQYIGAEIYATVGSDEKRRLLMDFYGIPEDHIFYSRTTAFAQGVKRMTNGRGVDVILNSLSGEGLIASWECIAPYGRFVEIGKKDIMDGEKLPMQPFSKNVTFSAVDMSSMGDGRPDHLKRILRAVMELVAAGTLYPPQPLQTYPISQIEQAFRHMQSGQSKGKSVVVMDKNNEVMTVLDSRPSFLFDGDVSFVIAGGLGGLGRSISRWMVNRGARNLILLSRSGPGNELGVALVKELEEKGVRVATPTCDIANASALQNALAACFQTMPPIKGCFQATAVLRDAMFERMTFEDWRACVDPKIRGSWNLHQYLPKGMDFFIFLSSICGVVGRETTANYAAANTFMDALAHHRILCGEKAASLDLGIMEEEGILAENKDLMARVKAQGNLIPILSTQLHALLDFFCDPKHGLLTSLRCQAVVGVEIPANLRSQGIEPASWMYQPALRHLFQMDGDKDVEAGTHQIVDFATAFTTIGSLVEAGTLVTDALIDKLSSSISVPKEKMDINKPMHQYGVDSLVAIEIRNWFAKKLKADIAVFDILGNSTFSDIGVLGAGKSTYKQASWDDV